LAVLYKPVGRSCQRDAHGCHPAVRRAVDPGFGAAVLPSHPHRGVAALSDRDDEGSELVDANDRPGAVGRGHFVALVQGPVRAVIERRPVVAGDSLCVQPGRDTSSNLSAGWFAADPRYLRFHRRWFCDEPGEHLGLLVSLAVTWLLLRRFAGDRQEKQRLAAELGAARVVQQLLLPDAAASTGSFILEAVYEPALEVGGDFYWTRLEADGALLVAVGDVSGKGLKAAMLVSLAIGILRTAKSPSPAGLLTALNDGLAGRAGGGFITCCCARFDVDGAVTLANAGHPSPYADGRELEVDAGLPLGVLAGAEYGDSMATGERFTFVSDGVVEAENARRELFGFERTLEMSTKPAAEIAAAAKAWGQTDDITVVTVRRMDRA
jgi:Stage II sporulation protein E (SpoIIE)